MWQLASLCPHPGVTLCGFAQFTEVKKEPSINPIAWTSLRDCKLKCLLLHHPELQQLDLANWWKGGLKWVFKVIEAVRHKSRKWHENI